MPRRWDPSHWVFLHNNNFEPTKEISHLINTQYAILHTEGYYWLLSGWTVPSLSPSVQCVYWWRCGSLTTRCDGWLMSKGVSADSFIMPRVILIHREQHAAAEELFSKILETKLLYPSVSTTVGSTFCTVCRGFPNPLFLCLPWCVSLSALFSSVAWFTEVKVSTHKKNHVYRTRL